MRYTRTWGSQEGVRRLLMRDRGSLRLVWHWSILLVSLLELLSVVLRMLILIAVGVSQIRWLIHIQGPLA